MDDLDLVYHLCFRPRAIRGRRPRPNGGHRRPRPVSGVYATRYTNTCPTSEPIGRASKFLEQQSFPNPVNTGVLFWDESNLKIKSLIEEVAARRKKIHDKSTMRPKLKDTSSKVASMWEACDVTLGMARELRHSLRQEGLIPYPEPLWFSSRETGMHTYLDIPKWNELVLESLSAKANDCSTLAAKVNDCNALAAKANDCSTLTAKANDGSTLAASFSKSGALAWRCKEGGKLASEEESSVLAEEGGATRASVGGNIAAEDCGEIAAEKGGVLSGNLQKNWSNLAIEKHERSSFINWSYYYQKIHNQPVYTEEQEDEKATSDDEGELKARWAWGA